MLVVRGPVRVSPVERSPYLFRNLFFLPFPCRCHNLDRVCDFAPDVLFSKCRHFNAMSPGEMYPNRASYIFGGWGGVKNFPDISRRKKGSKKFSGQTPVKLTFKYIFQINTCKITGKTIELKITKSFLVQWVKHIFRTNTSKIKVSK